MKIIHLFLILGINTFHTAIAQNDTIWYDTYWSEASKENAAYYRPSPKPKGDGFWVTDYYISGAKQMEGLSKQKDHDIFEGAVTWFAENGEITQRANYKEGELDGEFTSYTNGKEIAKAIYKNNKIESGTAISYREIWQCYFLREYQNGKPIKEIVYEEAPDKGTRIETSLEVGGLLKTKNYDKNGALIGTFTTSSEKMHDISFYDGKKIEYYYKPMRKKSETEYENGKFKNHVVFYPSGNIRERVDVKSDTAYITYFDENSKTLAKLTTYFKSGKDVRYVYTNPIKGTKISFNVTYNSFEPQRVVSIETYEDGKIEERKGFYENGNLKSYETFDGGKTVRKENYTEGGEIVNQLTYKDGKPYNGTETNSYGHTTTTYKDGVAVEEIEMYKNGSTFKKEMNNKAVFYDKKGKQIGELEYEINEYGRKKPYTGDLYQLTNNDKFYSKESYKEGVRIVQIFFHKKAGENESIKKTEAHFDDSGRKIRKKTYYDNGQLQTDMTYKKGYTREKATYYDKEGKLLSTMVFSPEKHGTEYEFFKEPADIRSINTYDEQGKLIYKKNYEKDYNVKNSRGEYSIYLKEEIDYNGKAAFYGRNNKLIAKATYKNGAPWEGKVVKGSSYHYTVTPYKNGKKEGDEIKYRIPKGGTPRVQRKRTYENDRLHGTSYVYFDDGRINSIENYKNGILDGEVIYYTEDGAERNKLIYKNGEPYEGLLITHGSRRYQKRSTIKKSYYKAGELTRTEKWEDEQLLREAIYTDKQLQVTQYDPSGDKTVFYNITDLKSKSGEVFYYAENGTQKEKGTMAKGKPVSGVFYLKKLYLGYATKKLPDGQARTIRLEVTKEKYTVCGLDENKEEVFCISESKKSPELYFLNDIVRPEYFYDDYLMGDL